MGVLLLILIEKLAILNYFLLGVGLGCDRVEPCRNLTESGQAI